MRSYKEILEAEIDTIINTTDKIVLFGTREMAMYAANALRYLGKDITCFADNAIEATKIRLFGKPVLLPDELDKSARIVICSFNRNHIQIIREQLRNLGFLKIHGSDALFYVYQMSIMQRPVDTQAFAETINRLNTPENRLIIGGGVRNLPVVITEKCTLRCRDCSVFMPYYSHPRHYAAEEIIQWVTRFASCVDVIEKLNIIGGETFLHPELDKICRELSRITNIFQLMLVTSGTVLPKEQVLQAMKNTVAMVVISDYGELSAKKSQLACKLKEYNIPYQIFSDEREWTRLLPPKKHGRPDTENTAIRKQCKWADITPKIIAGEYHICDYSAGISPFKVVPGTEDDYLSLADPIFNAVDGRKKIKYLKEEKAFLTVCDYCEFYGLHSTPRAVQTNKLLDIRGEL